MNEVIINKQLTDIRAYKKILKRILKIKQVDVHFQKFLVQAYTNYEKFANKYNQQCQNFDQTLIQSNFYSSTKCLEILIYTNLFKQLAISIKKMTRIILIGLKKFQNDQSDKLQKHFEGKLDQFLAILSFYSDQSKKMQKLKESYINKCNILNQSIQKFIQYKDPLSFYNPVISQEFSKQLDDKFKITLTKQSIVKEQINRMKQNKRKLQIAMKQMKQSSVTVFRYHTTKICDLVRIVLQDSQREAVVMKQIDKAGVIEQFCQSQFQRLRQYYQTNNKDRRVQQNSSQYPLVEIQTNQMNTNHKFFLQRCQNFIRMKKKSIQYSNICRRKSKDFLLKLIQEMVKMRNGYQQIKKTAFGNNKLQKFKKDLMKYLGQSVFNIFKLANKLVQRPLMAISKIQKSISVKISKIQTILTQQDKLFQLFQKQINHLFDDHKKLKLQIQGKTSVNRQIYAQFKKNIDITFQHFKQILSSFKSKQQKIHKYFIAEMHDIASTIQSQTYKKSLQQTLGQYKQLYQNFKNINIDSEVLKVMKYDKRYQVMFNSFFSQYSLIQFQSLMQTQDYQKMKKILQRKQGINRTIKGHATIGCCGVSKKHTFSGKEEFKFKCSLYNKNFIEGELQLLHEGIAFKSTNRGFFQDKIKIMIPRNDIKRFQKKDGLHLYSNAISIQTTMGQIVFVSFENRDIVMAKLSNLFNQQKKQPSQMSQKQQYSIRINSSDYKANDKTGLIKGESKQNIKREVEQGPLIGSELQNQIKNLMLKWQNEHNFFSNSFVESQLDKRGNVIKVIYTNKFNNVNVKIKQHKQLKLQDKNLITIDFKWKVSFPSTPIINSFLVDQKYSIQIIDGSININANLKKYSSTQSYLCDIFYKQIDNMNTKLAKFVSNNIPNQNCDLFPQVTYQQTKFLTSTYDTKQLLPKKSPQKRLSNSEIDKNGKQNKQLNDQANKQSGLKRRTSEQPLKTGQNKIKSTQVKQYRYYNKAIIGVVIILVFFILMQL